MNRTGQNLKKLADLLMTVSVPICNQAEEEDGTYYLPFTVVCAIKDFHLVGTTLHFDSQQQPEEVAKILRLTADHLEGKTAEGAEIFRNYMQ